jgi:hypothetical protein
MQTKSNTPLVVGGAVTAVVALAALAAAAGLLWVHAAKNDHGYLTTSSHRLRTPSRALVSMTVTVHSAVPRWVVERLRVEAASAKPLFLGVVRRSDLDAYLRGVSYATTDDLDAWPFKVHYKEHAGTRTPAAPGSLKIWAASAAGDLRWRPKRGRWAIVLMNADGSSGVDADVAVGAKVRGVLPTGIALAVVGALLAALAARLIAKGSRGRAR